MEELFKAALSAGGGPLFVLNILLLAMIWYLVGVISKTMSSPSLEKSLEAIKDSLDRLCDRIDRVLERGSGRR